MSEPLREDVLAALTAHAPADSVEAAGLRQTIALVRWLPSPLDEHADATHVTGSAIVTDGADRVVLHRHKRLGIWLQPGGHLDPREGPAAAAMRETAEETGLVTQHPDGVPRLLHVDVHPGPRGHLHLDLRYLLVADDVGFAPAAGESPDVAWFTADAAIDLGDASLGAAVRAARHHTAR